MQNEQILNDLLTWLVDNRAILDFKISKEKIILYYEDSKKAMHIHNFDLDHGGKVKDKGNYFTDYLLDAYNKNMRKGK